MSANLGRFTVERREVWAVRSPEDPSHPQVMELSGEKGARAVAAEQGGTPVRCEQYVLSGEWQERPNCPALGCIRPPHGAGSPRSLHIDSKDRTWS
jgi:hypothetical protein